MRVDVGTLSYQAWTSGPGNSQDDLTVRASSGGELDFRVREAVHDAPASPLALTAYG